MHSVLLLATIFLCALTSNGAEIKEVQRTTFLMGTWFSITVTAKSRDAAMASSDKVIDVVTKAEDRLSTWRNDTELSRLNSLKIGEKVRISKQLFRDLSLATECSHVTNGAFQPAAGALVKAWDLRGRFKVPSEVEKRRALDASQGDGFRLSNGSAHRLLPETQWEEGGFAKGLALEQAVLALKSHGIDEAILDFGGQIVVLSKTERSINVAHPAKRDVQIAKLLIADGSVSTSGNSERSKTDGTLVYNHILDPRTGNGALDFGSVTVWAKTAGWADCLSTGLYVLGPKAAMTWQSSHPEVEVLVLELSGNTIRATASCGLKGKISDLSPEVSLTFQCSSTPTTGKTTT
jgi:FAD:protein FMN transferase